MNLFKCCCRHEDDNEGGKQERHKTKNKHTISSLLQRLTGYSQVNQDESCLTVFSDNIENNSISTTSSNTCDNPGTMKFTSSFNDVSDIVVDEDIALIQKNNYGVCIHYLNKVNNDNDKAAIGEVSHEETDSIKHNTMDNGDLNLSDFIMVNTKELTIDVPDIVVNEDIALKQDNINVACINNLNKVNNAYDKAVIREVLHKETGLIKHNTMKNADLKIIDFAIVNPKELTSNFCVTINNFLTNQKPNDFNFTFDNYCERITGFLQDKSDHLTFELLASPTGENDKNWYTESCKNIRTVAIGNNFICSNYDEEYLQSHSDLCAKVDQNINVNNNNKATRKQSNSYAAALKGDNALTDKTNSRENNDNFEEERELYGISTLQQVTNDACNAFSQTNNPWFTLNSNRSTNVSTHEESKENSTMLLKEINEVSQPTSNVLTKKSVIPTIKLKKYKRESSKTFEVQLEKIPKGGYLVNRKIHIATRNWHCITGTHKKLFCEACKRHFEEGYNHHAVDSTHKENLGKCKILPVHRIALIRKVNNGRYHCAICNETFTQKTLTKHLCTEEHKRCLALAKGKAHLSPDVLKTLKRESMKLDVESSQLNSQSVAKTMQPNSSTRATLSARHSAMKLVYTNITSLLEVPKGGYILNKTMFVAMGTWNGLTKTSHKLYCNICQEIIETANGSHHCADKRHQNNLINYKFMSQYDMNLIRELPNQQYYCGICGSICPCLSSVAAHISSAPHRGNYANSKNKAAQILRNGSKCVPVCIGGAL